MRTAVLGAGSWGTTFAKVLADAGGDVTLVGRRPELVAAVRALRLRPRTPAGRIGEILALCSSLPADSADRDLTGDLAMAAELIPSLAELAELAESAGGRPGAQTMSSSGRSSSA